MYVETDHVQNIFLAVFVVNCVFFRCIFLASVSRAFLLFSIFFATFVIICLNGHKRKAM